MATIINTPGSNESSGLNAVAVIVLIGILLLLLIYGVPQMGLGRTGGTSTNNGGGVSVPRQIDVNLNNPGNAGNSNNQ